MMTTKLPGFHYLRMADDGTGAGAGAGAGDAGAAGGKKDENAGAGAGAGTSGDAAAAAAKAGAGAGDDKGAGAGAGDANKPAWGDKWRQDIAGVDAKDLARLERFTTPADMLKKLKEQDALISQTKRPLAKDATPEQVTAWRKDNGIPETFDKYDLTLKDGLVIGESDKPVVESMLKTMHAKNLDNDTVKEMLSAYYQNQKDFISQRAAAIDTFKREQESVLNKEWGADYKTNMTAGDNMMATWPKDAQDAIKNALDSNMMPLLNNAAFRKSMALMARELNPIDPLTAGMGSSQVGSVQEELATLTKQMGDRTSAYWKGPLVDGRNTAGQLRVLKLNAFLENQKKTA